MESDFKCHFYRESDARKISSRNTISYLFHCINVIISRNLCVIEERTAVDEPIALQKSLDKCSVLFLTNGHMNTLLSAECLFVSLSNDM